MSDCYEYTLHCEFPLSLSPHIVETLRYMVRTEDYSFNTQLNHPLFASEELYDGERHEAWRSILQTESGGLSQGHPEEDPGYFARFFRAARSDFVSSDASYMLSFRTKVQDDEEGQMHALLQWLATISNSQGFVGYSIRQGHGVSEHPTLWYFENQHLVSRKVDEMSARRS